MSATSETKPRRRWKTISLRGLMLVVLLLALVLARQTNLARRQRHAVDVIKRAGGRVAFDDVMKPNGVLVLQGESVRTPWQRWVVRNLGDEYVLKVVDVRFDHFTPRDNRPSRLGPEVWSSLRALSDTAGLNLEGMNVTDDDFAVIGSLTHLRRLELPSNPAITGAGLAKLAGLKDLALVQLEDTPVGDEGMRHLAACSHLAHLRLSGTRVTDATLALIPHWPELESLSLSGTRITDAGLVHLRGLKKLRYLTLDNTQVTDVGLANLAGLTTLETLFLDETPTTDAGIEHLAQLARLRDLSLGRGVTDKSLPILEQLNRLLTLHVATTQISPKGAAELSKALPGATIVR